MTEKQIKTISILDPAIDWVATPLENVRRFINEDREDLSLLTMRSGETPAVYTLRVIPHEVASTAVVCRESAAEKYTAAFRASLVHVADGYKADGKRFVGPWTPLMVQAGKKSLHSAVSILTDDELEQFEFVTIQEIGAVAFSRFANFHRGTVLSWQLPQYVLDTWGQVRSRFPAVPAETTAASGESAPSEAPRPVVPWTSEESPSAIDAALPGGATATESPTSLRG